MFKHSLAILVIGSMTAGSCFAIPFSANKIFLNEQMKKMAVSNNDPQNNNQNNNQTKFSGIWAGTCSVEGQNSEIKLRINDTNHYISIRDFDEPHGGAVYFYNLSEQKNLNTSTWFHNSTDRFARINDTTLQYESRGIGGEQLGSSSQNVAKDKHLYASMFTMTYTLNNDNQLNINMHMKSEDMNKKNHEMNGSCVLNRAG